MNFATILKHFNEQVNLNLGTYGYSGMHGQWSTFYQFFFK